MPGVARCFHAHKVFRSEVLPLASLSRDDKLFTFARNKYGTGKPVPYGETRGFRGWRAECMRTILERAIRESPLRGGNEGRAAMP